MMARFGLLTNLDRIVSVLAISLLAQGCSDAGVSAPAAAQAGAGLVGAWTLNIDTPRGVQNPKLVVRESAGGYSATYDSRQGVTQIDEVTIDGNRFSFPMELTIPIGTIEVEYKGQIDGDQLQGVVENPRGQVPFSGVRG